jgi:hypothetical protein
MVVEILKAPQAPARQDWVPENLCFIRLVGETSQSFPEHGENHADTNKEERDESDESYSC